MGNVARRRGVCSAVLIEEGGILQMVLQGEKNVPTEERIRDIKGGILCVKGWR